MISLMRAELKKIFHKKSFYVVTIIFILFSILVNVLYKTLDKDIEFNREYSTYEIDIGEVENNLLRLDINNSEDIFPYIENSTLLEVNRLRSEYSSNTDIYLIDTFIYDLIYESLEKKYMFHDEEGYQSIRLEIDGLLVKLKNGDYKAFISRHTKKLVEIMDSIDDPILLKVYEARLKLNQYRIDNNVGYESSDYLNNAIIDIEHNLYEYYNLDSKLNKTSDEQNTYNYLKEEILKNRYILENKLDVNNPATLRSVLINFASEFGLFILIYVILISGSIVSEEFNKGTIKSLLIKPFKRSTILTSKYLVIVVLLPLIILGMFLVNMAIGSIIFGFSSLDIPVLIYDSASGIITTCNVFIYNIELLISLLPIYFVLLTLCFMISTVTASTSSAVTLTFLFYLVGNIIPNLYEIYDIKVLKAFVSLHWDFSYLVNLNENPYGGNVGMSLAIVLIYIVVMLCIAYVYFMKKDVKNI